jgi:hypothetical protein
MSCLVKAIPMFHSSVQPFPAKYFQQEIVVIPVKSGTLFGLCYYRTKHDYIKCSIITPTTGSERF